MTERSIRPGLCLGRTRVCLAPSLVFALAFLAACVASHREARAQSSAAVPPASYYRAVGLYQNGDFKSALDQFKIELQGGFKIGQNRWVDSICLYAMVGECHYQLGNYPAALEHFNACLNHWLSMRDWLIKARFTDDIRPAQAGQIRSIAWGPPGRRVKHGSFPEEVLVLQGDDNPAGNNQVVRTGGIFVQPTLRPVGVYEQVRTLGLALRRRRELVGPAAERDPMGEKMIAALSRQITSSGHWSRVFADAHLGLAYAAAGNDIMARPMLVQSATAAGGYDHPLTPACLFELGRIDLTQGNFVSAANFFFEASCSAAQFQDVMLIEESLRYGHMAHLLANRTGAYPPLAIAMEWARRNQKNLLYASTATLVAESFSLHGQPDQAAAALAEARKTVQGNSMATARIGARVMGMAAQVAYQQGNLVAGDKSLAAAIAIQQNVSLWLWHIRLADGLWRQQAITAREAMRLYEFLLREPRSADWLSEPLESHAVMSTPRADFYARWFLVAIERKQFESALEIADLARRHRFFSTLPLGGRLLALKWMLSGPLEMLTPQDQLERRDLLGAYPQYARLVQQAEGVRQELAAMPLVAADPMALRKQSDAIDSLASLAAAQDLVLRQMAVRRLPCRMIFPPKRSVAELREALPEKQAILEFFFAGDKVYGILAGKDVFNVWEAGSVADIHDRTIHLMRQLGNVDGNRPLGPKQLVDTTWQKTARELWLDLTKASSSDFQNTFDELVIVPDGALWYVPFEMLSGGTGPLMIEQTRVRYAPTASLAIPFEHRLRHRDDNLVAAVGRLYPRDDLRVGDAAFAQLKGQIPTAIALTRKPLPGPMSLYSAIFDRLVVLDDIAAPQGSAYSFSPVPLAAGSPGSTLDHWLTSPHRSPDQVVLPGFHSAAEDAMKTMTPALAGSDVFLPVFGLLASGSRTVLVSRWRTGGQNCHDLVREFVQELPHASAAEAWQRSVLLACDTALKPELEPRLEIPATMEPPKARHPFFWSGYLVIDSGSLPRKQDDEDLETLVTPGPLPKPAAKTDVPAIPGRNQ